MLEGYGPLCNIHTLHFRGLFHLWDLSTKEASWVLDSGDFLRFCFVRNPYSRLYSAYQSKIAVAYDGPQHEQFHQNALKRRSKIRSRIGASVSTIDFSDFVEYTTSLPDEDRDRHWRQQTSLTRCDLIHYDFIGRQESFEQDFDSVLCTLGANDAILADAKEFRNRTITRDWREHYDAPIADKVYRAYEADFEHFGYSRDSWNNEGV